MHPKLMGIWPIPKTGKNGLRATIAPRANIISQIKKVDILMGARLPHLYPKGFLYKGNRLVRRKVEL